MNLEVVTDADDFTKLQPANTSRTTVWPSGLVRAFADSADGAAAVRTASTIGDELGRAAR